MNALHAISYDAVSQYCEKYNLDGDKIYGAMWLRNPKLQEIDGATVNEQYIAHFRNPFNGYRYVEVIAGPDSEGELNVKWIGIEGLNIDRNEPAVNVK